MRTLTQPTTSCLSLLLAVVLVFTGGTTLYAQPGPALRWPTWNGLWARSLFGDP